MQYGITVVVEPAEEPVSVAEMKLWLRQDLPHDDELIAAVITAARRQAELETERAFVTRTYELTLDGFPGGDRGLVLPYPPLRAVVSVRYVNLDGVETAFTTYAVDTTRNLGWLLPAFDYQWPTDVRGQANAVTVRYTAGFGTAAQVPAEVKAAVKMMAAQLYEFRDGTATGAKPLEMPLTACRLLRGQWTGEV